MEEEEKQKELDMLAKNESASEHELRYKRLMCLLDRSKFYANFLLERMAAKKKEEELKVYDFQRM